MIYTRYLLPEFFSRGAHPNLLPELTFIFPSRIRPIEETPNSDFSNRLTSLFRIFIQNNRLSFRVLQLANIPNWRNRLEISYILLEPQNSVRSRTLSRYVRSRNVSNYVFPDSN